MENEKKEFENVTETANGGIDETENGAVEEKEDVQTDFAENEITEETEISEENISLIENSEESDAEIETDGDECLCCECECGCTSCQDGENIEFNEFGEADELEQAPKKSGKFVAKAVIAAVVVIAAAATAYSVAVQNGFGGKSVVNTKLPAISSEAEKDGEEEKALNVKFENPFITMFESKATGAESALKAGNYSVSKGAFEYFVKNSALNYEYTLYMNKDITDLSKFSWETVDKSGLTNAEIAKGKAVETLAPIVSAISVAADRGIALSDDEIKDIESSIEEIKTTYGDSLGEALKSSGFDNIEQFREVRILQTLYNKVYQDFNENPTDYMKGFKNYRENLSDDKITVKHILVKFPNGITNASTDEEKAETKKKAEEVLAKVNSGEDFDALVGKYNEDPGAGKNGYTFANDGTMVKEFSDAAFALELGKTSGLVETNYGYHIIKRCDRIPTFEEFSEIAADNITVKINRPYYSKLNVDVNLEDYIGDTASNK